MVAPVSFTVVNTQQMSSAFYCAMNLLLLVQQFKVNYWAVFQKLIDVYVGQSGRVLVFIS